MKASRLTSLTHYLLHVRALTTTSRPILYDETRNRVLAKKLGPGKFQISRCEDPKSEINGRSSEASNFIQGL
ncbi:hypothetical protein GJ744_008519 [Endocarpon pusillum]|uniref:Uncharacterized protein n=1 Tax=Endocarpon pusillum TaxID=364733 RepID=A0A8H7E5I2_9EURO|nr:hypothetical protein GJ744_008519 [Endocarpon pusillum]